VIVGGGLLAGWLVLAGLLGPGDGGDWQSGSEGSADTWPPVPVKPVGDHHPAA